MGNEIAEGEYPVNALIYVAKIAVESEVIHDSKKYFKELRQQTSEILSVQETAAVNAIQTCNEQDINILIVQTQTGNIARLLSKYKPSVDLFAVSEEDHILAILNLSRGIFTIKSRSLSNEENLRRVCAKIKERTLAEIGAKVLIISMDKEGDWEEEVSLKVI